MLFKVSATNKYNRNNIQFDWSVIYTAHCSIGQLFIQRIFWLVSYLYSALFSYSMSKWVFFLSQLYSFKYFLFNIDNLYTII